jgi:hypothetical protein
VLLVLDVQLTLTNHEVCPRIIEDSHGWPFHPVGMHYTLPDYANPPFSTPGSATSLKLRSFKAGIIITLTTMD